MPLAIYRRHSADCQFFERPRRDSRSQKCQCPIWVQGSLGGEYLRRSLDLVSWEAAQDRVRGWEASGEVGVVKADVPDIATALDRFLHDVKSRGLSDAMGAAICPRRRRALYDREPRAGRPRGRICASRAG